jgi:hypothetical protein
MTFLVRFGSNKECFDFRDALKSSGTSPDHRFTLASLKLPGCGPAATKLLFLRWDRAFPTATGQHALRSAYRGWGRFINNQFSNPESCSAQMPAAFFNGAAFGRGGMTSVPRYTAQKETAPARGQLEPSLGCAEGAERHGLLNRRSGDCSPSKGFTLHAATDSEQSCRGRWPVRLAGYRPASFRCAWHHSTQAFRALSRDSRQQIGTIPRS